MKKRMIGALGVIAALVLTAGIVWVVSKAGRAITIDEQNFPDAVFRAYVSENYDTDHDGSLTPGERRAVKECLVSRKEIQSLQGIEHFPNLEKLDCSLNPLRRLNVSKNTRLTSLNVRGGEVTKDQVRKRHADHAGCEWM